MASEACRLCAAMQCYIALLNAAQLASDVLGRVCWAARISCATILHVLSCIVQVTDPLKIVCIFDQNMDQVAIPIIIPDLGSAPELDQGMGAFFRDHVAHHSMVRIGTMAVQALSGCMRYCESRTLCSHAFIVRRTTPCSSHSLGSCRAVS